MKRRTKLFLIMAALVCLACVGVVLNKIQQNAAMPFPGAVVVLDDASWYARRIEQESDRGYLWATHNTILYTQKAQTASHIVQRKVMPDGTLSPPKVLPLLLGKEQVIESLSPDGKILCLRQTKNDNVVEHILVRTDGQGKPVDIVRDYFGLVWSADSKYLYFLLYTSPKRELEQFDAQTGTLAKTILNTTEEFDLTSTTPEGKLLGTIIDVDYRHTPLLCDWSVTEVQGNKVLTRRYRKQFASDCFLAEISPDNNRLLWIIPDVQITWLEKWQQRVFKKPIMPRKVWRWQVSDIDGKNERAIGVTLRGQRTENEPSLQWTPDGKGVHFLQDGKLMYLVVP